MLNKGKWVQIHNVVLEASERAPQVPDDTKKVPLEMWVKGYLQTEAEIGEKCTIITATGREVEGTLVGVEIPYEHNYGEFVEELNVVRDQVKGILFE